MKPIFINKRKISNKNSPYILFKHSNHDGSINKAKKTIKAAKIGADAVKFRVIRLIQ